MRLSAIRIPPAVIDVGGTDDGEVFTLSHAVITALSDTPTRPEARPLYISALATRFKLERDTDLGLLRGYRHPTG
jgi:hypothetical protein